MKSILRIILALAVMIAAGRVSFDLNISDQVVPITGQTLAVLVSALLLPRWEALIAIISYLALGAFGQPVFADGEYGMDKLTGNGAGYLWGFLLATFSVSTNRGYKDSRSLVSILTGNVVGTAIILFVGFAVLSYHIGAQSAFSLGVVPYWTGGVVKILMGTLVVFGIKKAVG